MTSIRIAILILVVSSLSAAQVTLTVPGQHPTILDAVIASRTVSPVLEAMTTSNDPGCGHRLEHG